MKYGFSLITDEDTYLFKEGNHFRLYERSDRTVIVEGETGTYFAVWAPNAEKVFVIGDFNSWNKESHPLAVRWDGSGIFEGFIPGIGPGSIYKYHIQSRENGYRVDKSDPYARHCETPSKTGSIVWDDTYRMERRAWMENRARVQRTQCPLFDLRSPFRFMDEGIRGPGRPVDELPGDGGISAGLYKRDGFYPCRISPPYGTSLLRVVGIPDHGLLSPQRRATGPLRTSCT